MNTNPANDNHSRTNNTSRRIFRGVEFTVELESGGFWCWYRDDGVGGVRNGFVSAEAAAADARLVINGLVDNSRNPANDNHGHANDNGERAVAPAPAGGALASLTALATALNRVDLASVIGRSGMPILQFKREGSGTWSYGQRRTVVEDGSRWAVNPLSFRWGFICFGEGNKVIGERLVPVSLPKPEVTELPDKGFPWSEQWAVNVKCTTGADAGVEADYKPTTDGGIKAVAGLIDAVRVQLNSGQHGGKVSPIVQLGKDSYQHSQFGRVWTPLLTIVDWMPLSGPAPAPEPASPQPTEQASTSAAPRRRRVA
jgi:hypothetical protein